MPAVVQRSFAAGEVTPSLLGRSDIGPYQKGLKTCRNFIVTKQGTIGNRGGFEFIGEVKDSTKAARLLRFVFSDEQTYVIEAGDLYFRFWQNGVALTIPAHTTLPTWSNATTYLPGAIVIDAFDAAPYVCNYSTINQQPHSNTGVAKPWRPLFWSNAYAYTAGDFVTAAATGNPNLYYVCIADSTNNDPGASPTFWYPLTPAANVGNPIVEIPTPYTADELFSLRIVQSADVVTITHPNHPPMELARLGSYDWKLTAISTTPAVAAPTGVTLTGSAGAVTTLYQVTAIDLVTGAESLAGVAHTASPATVTSVSAALTLLTFGTAAAHGFSSGTSVVLDSFTGAGRTTSRHVFGPPYIVYDYTKGLADLNGSRFIVDVIDATHFTLRGVKSADYIIAGSYGHAAPIGSNSPALAAPGSTTPITASWDASSTVQQFNVYRAVNGVYGYIGSTPTNTFRDDGSIAPDTTRNPPSDARPFSDPSLYPSAVAYIQQRLAFANQVAKPYHALLSRVGDYHNFTTRTTLQDDDALSFSIASDEVQEIRGLADLAGRLLLFASNGIYTMQGDANGVITPVAINLRRQSTVGSADLPPIVIDGAAIYVEARAARVRELQYQFASDGYLGGDLSAFASHLVDRFSFIEWAYARHPESIVWAVRSDGALVGLTYLKDQQVAGWHRHDTLGGTYESCVTVPEGSDDALYALVNRTISGTTKRYIERLHSRVVTDITVDCCFLDSFQTFDGRNGPDTAMVTTTGKSTAPITLDLSGGTTWDRGETLVLTADLSGIGTGAGVLFSSGNVGDIYELIDAANGEYVRVLVVGYTDATHLTVQPTDLVPVAVRSAALTTWSWEPHSLTGLGHLEGQTVGILGDGSYLGTAVVTSGAIAMPSPAAVVHVGLPITAEAELLDLDDPQGETLIGKPKNIARATVLANFTRGLYAGPDADNLLEVKQRRAEQLDEALEPATDTFDVRLLGRWNNNGRVLLRQTSPLPVEVLAVVRHGGVGT